jgi:hypothetical protein
LSVKTILILCISVLWASRVAAYFDARIEVSPQNGFNEISVIIVDPSPPYPDHGPYLGYAVVRYRHFDCSDPIFVSGVTDFSEATEVTDSSPPEDCAYTYIVSAIDEAGEPVKMAGWRSIRTLGGLDHPIIRGDLRSFGMWGVGLVYGCTDICRSHPYLGGAGVSGPRPDALVEARDTGQVFDIYGEIDYGFEGPFFNLVSEALPTTCDAQVATQGLTWSSLKSLYR